jgi:hypothetical protein
MAQFLTIVGPASVAVVAVGCSGAVGGADLVVERWVVAASAGDCVEMYDLLDGTVQATLSPETFSDWCAANSEQLSQDAAIIGAGESDLQVVATLAAYGGEPVQLVRERSGSGPWRLKERLVPPSGGHSPLELLATLQSLVDSALVSHTLGVMTPEYQQDFLAELYLVRDAISRSDSAEVEVWADQAQISLGDTVVHLRRVNQVWQIQSVESDYYTGYDYY